MSKEGSFIQGKYSCSLNVSNIENNSLNVNSGPPKKPVGGLKKTTVFLSEIFKQLLLLIYYIILVRNLEISIKYIQNSLSEIYILWDQK